MARNDDDDIRRREDAANEAFKAWQQREAARARKERDAAESQYRHDKVHGGRAVHGRDSCLVTGIALVGVAVAVAEAVKVGAGLLIRGGRCHAKG